MCVPGTDEAVRALLAEEPERDDRGLSRRAALNDMRFPGFSGDATEWLLSKRRIGGIGVDTLSLDNGPSTTFASHLAVLRADRVGVENLANLHKLPPRGATVVMGLIPWREGSGGPARVLATY